MLKWTVTLVIPGGYRNRKRELLNSVITIRASRTRREFDPYHGPDREIAED